MNRYTSLDNIFNYIPSSVRRSENDDDQLKSWAMQGLRLLNFDNLRMVEDFTFLDLANHKATIPNEVKSIISVELLVDDVLLGFSDYITENPDFDITYFNIHQDSLDNLFRFLERVDAKAFDYYCNVRDCRYIYSITDNVLQSPFETGCLAIKYWTEYKKGDDIQLPEKPESLWNYISSYAIMKHWEDRINMQQQGSGSLYQTYQYKTHSHYASAKAELVMRNAKIKNLKHNLYGESNIIKIYPFLIQYYSNARY